MSPFLRFLLRAGQRIAIVLPEIPREAPRPAREVGRARILVMDDEEGVRAVVQAMLDGRRIALLERVRDDLASCIGCGCLSLTRCTLFNPGDEAASEGTGSRWVRRATS